MNFLKTLFIFSLVLYFNSTTLNAQILIHIPDPNFKTYLLNDTTINTNGDNEIQETEAESFTGEINCHMKNIDSLIGIGAFINLTKLICSRNNLVHLDVRNNTKLVFLHCAANSITRLDLSQNSELVWLFCSDNPIGSLDLRQNTKLEKLYCTSTSLGDLNVRNGNNINIKVFDIRNNSSLTCVKVDNVLYSTTSWTDVDSATSFSTSCSGAPVVYIPDANFKAYLVGNSNINTNGNSEIEVSEASSFTRGIDCAYLNIRSLIGIEAFVNLSSIECSFNDLVSLNVISNVSLRNLNCSNNNLSSLTVKNGNNRSLRGFEARNNPNLTCIEVDDVAYSRNNWRGGIDPSASFNTNCVSPIVYVPDPNFKTYLLLNPTINTNNDSEIQVSEAVAFTGEINCPNRYIENVIGIEAFVNLTKLICNDNDIDKLDVSQNTDLLHLVCYRNDLSVLDVSQNRKLTWLHCADNSISSLNVTRNRDLSWLYCSHNRLISLDVSQNTKLKKLYCNSNFPLRSLDVSHNRDLERLYCGSTGIRTLDLVPNRSLKELNCVSARLNNLNIRNGNNTNITLFDVFNNPRLTCIEVDHAPYSTINWTGVDATASFNNVSCTVIPMANMPNTNFAGHLAENHSINTNNEDTYNSINTINKEMNLSAYPNPTTREITLDIGKIYQEANIQITNVTGHIVGSRKLENSSATTLTLEGAAGVYFLNIQTEEGSRSIKLIKR